MRNGKIFANTIYTEGVFAFEIIAYIMLISYFDYMKTAIGLYIFSFAVSSFAGAILLLLPMKKNKKNLLLLIFSASSSAFFGIIITAAVYSQFNMIYRLGNSFNIIIKTVISAASYFIVNILSVKIDNEVNI